MTDNEMLGALKVDIGLTSDAYDDRLRAYLEAAEQRIAREGVTIDKSDIDHVETIIMYAHWMWSKRDSGEGMPRMVRYQLNNLIFHEATEEKA